MGIATVGARLVLAGKLKPPSIDWDQNWVIRVSPITIASGHAILCQLYRAYFNVLVYVTFTHTV